LPVSLDRIREALDQPSPATLLRGLTDTPMFRIEIRARQKIEELLATLDFKSGPTPPGGVYGYEQQRQVFPAVNYPLAQPYAAFNTGQLLTVAAENLAGQALGARIGDSFSKAQRQRAQAAARRVVDEAIAEYCASKPNGGAGIQLCETLPVDRCALASSLHSFQPSGPAGSLASFGLDRDPGLSFNPDGRIE